MTESRQFMSDKAKILVVDDQMAVALMMVFLLERVGCDTQTALNAEKALRLAQAGPFDLITLDVGMPDLDGFTLFQKLKLIPHLKVLIFWLERLRERKTTIILGQMVRAVAEVGQPITQIRP